MTKTINLLYTCLAFTKFKNKRKTLPIRDSMSCYSILYRQADKSSKKTEHTGQFIAVSSHLIFVPLFSLTLDPFTTFLSPLTLIIKLNLAKEVFNQVKEVFSQVKELFNKIKQVSNHIKQVFNQVKEVFNQVKEE